MKDIFNKQWYVVVPPFGDGTWINAGAPDAGGEFVIDCNCIDPEIAGFDDKHARYLAKHLVALHNDSLIHKAKP